MNNTEIKNRKMFYSIGEVAEILGESTSLVRFWSDKFSDFIKPDRNGKGDRKYNSSDIETIKRIHLLVKGRGMTLEGAKEMMKNNTPEDDRKAELIGRLTKLKNELLNISKSLNKYESR